MAARLRERYKTDVFPALQEKFHYNNVMEVPKLEKITLNMGLGDCKDNPKLLEQARQYLWEATKREFNIPKNIVHPSDVIYKFRFDLKPKMKYQLVKI